MGGSSGGGPTRIGNVQSLIEQAKAELKGKRNVFISFAMEDLGEVNLLRGQAKNENSPIEFNDWSVSEPYDSERAEYIKQRISERILQSSVTSSSTLRQPPRKASGANGRCNEASSSESA